MANRDFDLYMKYKVMDLVAKDSGDYYFSGYVVAAFEKLSGIERYVVENEDGMLFIFNEKQLEMMA